MAPRGPQEHPQMCPRPPMTTPVRPRTPKLQCSFAFREIRKKSERSFLTSSNFCSFLATFPSGHVSPKHPKAPLGPPKASTRRPKSAPRGLQVHPRGPTEPPRTSQGAPQSSKGVAEEPPRAQKSSRGAHKKRPSSEPTRTPRTADTQPSSTKAAEKGGGAGGDPSKGDSIESGMFPACRVPAPC